MDETQKERLFWELNNVNLAMINDDDDRISVNTVIELQAWQKRLGEELGQVPTWAYDPGPIDESLEFGDETSETTGEPVPHIPGYVVMMDNDDPKLWYFESYWQDNVTGDDFGPIPHDPLPSFSW